MDNATRGLLHGTGLNFVWLVAAGFFYWLFTPSPATVPITLLAALGSWLMLRITIRIFRLWYDIAKQRPPTNFIVPALALAVYFCVLIAMWSFLYVFLARIADGVEGFPFCSGSDPMDPNQFGLREAIYFTVTSFATVGYGDVYACTSASRWAVIVELSHIVMIGFIGLPALVNLVSDIAQRKFAQVKSAGGADDMPFVSGFMVTSMAIIVFAEPVAYGILAAAFTADGKMVERYAGISATMLIPIAVGALVLAANRMLGGHETRSIPLKRAIWLVLLAYALFVEGFGYLYLLLDRPGANAFAFARATEHRLDFGTASYFSLTTLTTTGFGDIAPLSPTARIAAIAEILIGIVFTLFAFGLVVSAIVSQRVQSRA